MLHPDALISNTPQSPHPEKIRIALTYLHDRGARFVMLHPDGVPCWQGFLHGRRLALERVLHHALLGIVPWSLRTSALDVDAGDPFQLSLFHPPLASIPSRNPDGARCHCYYPDTQPRGNAKFTLCGCTGDVRSAKGYLRLWRDAPVYLLDALLHNADNAAPFPYADLDVPATKYREPKEPGEPYTRRVSAPDIDLSKIGRNSRMRNTSLFDVVRYWAYAEGKPASMAAWDDAVRIYANTRNLEFPAPLKVPEVNKLALSVSSWVWNGDGPTHHTWTLEQRSRGGQTWAAHAAA